MVVGAGVRYMLLCSCEGKAGRRLCHVGICQEMSRPRGWIGLHNIYYEACIRNATFRRRYVLSGGRQVGCYVAGKLSLLSGIALAFTRRI